MKRKLRWITLSVSVVLVLSVVAVLVARRRPVKPQETVVAASTGDISLKILVTGSVQSQNRLEIKPPTAGRIEEIRLQEGDSVRKGQILAWMSSSERVSLLDAARANGAEEVKRWKELYRATPILSPLTGTLNSEQRETGPNGDQLRCRFRRLGSSDCSSYGG